MGIFDFFKMLTARNTIADSYDKSELEQQLFLEKVFDSFKQGKIQEGYRMICKRNAEMPFSPGLNCDWGKRYHEGLSKSNEELYFNYLERLSYSSESLCALFAYLSGDSVHSVCRLYNKYFLEDLAEEYNIRYCNSLLSTQRDFNSYNTTDVNEYMYFATLDIHTCSVCGELDGKIFPVDQAKIGINCPPIHKGCRCTTVAVIDQELFKDMTRIARNPTTGKTNKVPLNMNYKEWHNKYVEGRNLSEQCGIKTE